MTHPNDLPNVVRSEFVSEVKRTKESLENEAALLDERADSRLSRFNRIADLDCGCRCHEFWTDDGWKTSYWKRVWELCDGHMHLDGVI